MPLRTAAYQVRVWERCHKERRRSRLPPVLAVLVSHAPGGWIAPCSFEELFEPAVLAVPGLAPLVPRCSMVVLDLARLSDAELRARSLPALQKVTLWLLRDARAPARLLASFDAWAPIMRRAGRTRPGLDAQRVLIGYMYKVVGPTRHAKLDAKLLTLGPGTKEVIMTIADMFREEGRAKGRAEGRIEGRIAQLRSLLNIKFGTLDAASEARLRTATPPELDRYSRRLLTAASLAEVFQGRARRRAPRPRPRGSSRVRPGRA